MSGGRPSRSPANVNGFATSAAIVSIVGVTGASTWALLYLVGAAVVRGVSVLTPDHTRHGRSDGRADRSISVLCSSCNGRRRPATAMGRVRIMTTPSRLYRHERPLREIVSDEIRSRIFSGVFPPGTRLVERNLADELGVSRFPVREALRILHKDGLVEHLPTRGIVVRQPSRAEVEEIFDIRESLEVLAARLAAQRVDSGTPSTLHEHVTAARTALEWGDLDGATRSNSEFHDELIRLAGSATLQEVLGPLMGRLHWLFAQVSDPDQVCREHEVLCAAIESAGPHAAALAAQRHVLSYKRRTLQHLYG
jgi:DNA-binding GntR family transcriptional regulator